MILMKLSVDKLFSTVKSTNFPESVQNETKQHKSVLSTGVSQIVAFEKT